MAAPLLAVDAPSLLFRAYHALPKTITDGAGHPVGALLGSANVLLQTIERCAPRAVVLCFGPDAAPYRVELYDAYHAERPPVPDDLAHQFAQAQRFFATFGWESAYDETLEADDLLASYAAAERDAGGSALILTGDRDMFQCAAEAVTVLYLRTGVKGYEEVDAGEVVRRYGVPPSLVPDFIALRGDPSDGIPGARGVGEKTAATLLGQHGSLEALLDGWRRVRPARAAGALRDQRDELLRFKRIATLQTRAVDLPESRPTDREGGARAARELGMNRLAERLERGG